MVIEGELEVADERLKSRDAVGLSGIDQLALKTVANTSFLLLEIPMN